MISHLEKLLHDNITNADIYHMAFTHPSIYQQANKNNLSSPHYQRLEFLGDRVLGLVIAQKLYDDYPDEDEGKLAKRLSHIVQQSSLAHIARQLDFPNYIIIHPNAKAQQEHHRDSVLCDVMESFIAAIYLDKGFDTAQYFILMYFANFIKEHPQNFMDAKTQLQEYSLHHYKELPTYTLLSQSGSDHHPIFHIQVSLPNGEIADGKGNSKKKAETAAAQKLLQSII